MLNDAKIDQYIRRSNAIDGITAGPGHLEYDQHRAALDRVVGAALPVDSRIIHCILMKGLMPEAWQREGEYRSEDIYVGPWPMVRHGWVSELMGLRA